MAQQPSRLKPLHQQAGWFVLVGSAAAAVHFTMLLMLVRLAGLGPAWANVWAFALAFCVSFAGHFRLTFYQYGSHRAWQRSLWRWLASSVAAFLLNQALFVLGLAWFGRAWYALIWLVVTAVVTVLTFALGKFWAFGRTESSVS